MLTESLNLSNHLINRSVGTVKFIDIRSQSKPHLGRIFVVYDDDKASETAEYKQITGDLKHGVPIIRSGKSFLCITVCKNLTWKRKQCSLILAHALTVHKS